MDNEIYKILKSIYYRLLDKKLYINQVKIEDKPIIEWLKPGMYKLTHDVKFEVEYFIHNNIICVTYDVPKGFITDLASIPRIFWWYIAPWDKIGLPAILHDYLYSNHCKYKYIPRWLADRLFLKGMLDYGVRKDRAYIAYWSVRLFGKSHFDRKYDIKTLEDFITNFLFNHEKIIVKSRI